MAMTPRARSAGASEASLVNAPRSLNELVTWRFSYLTETSAPVSADSLGAGSVGVRSTWPAMVRRARSMSASVTFNVSSSREGTDFRSPDELHAALLQETTNGRIRFEPDGALVGLVGGIACAPVRLILGERDVVHQRVERREAGGRPARLGKRNRAIDRHHERTGYLPQGLKEEGDH